MRPIRRPFVGPWERDSLYILLVRLKCLSVKWNKELDLYLGLESAARTLLLEAAQPFGTVRMVVGNRRAVSLILH